MLPKIQVSGIEVKELGTFSLFNFSGLDEAMKKVNTLLLTKRIIYPIQWLENNVGNTNCSS